MTAAELIAELQKLPPDTVILVPCGMDCGSTAELQQVRPRRDYEGGPEAFSLAVLDGRP